MSPDPADVKAVIAWGYGWARRHCPRWAEPEDLQTEVLLAVWRAGQEYGPHVVCFKAYATKFVKRGLADYLRYKRPGGRVPYHQCHAPVSLDTLIPDPDDLLDEALTVPDPVAMLDHVDYIWEQVSLLSPTHRAVIVLRFALDLDVKEIGRRFGRSPSWCTGIVKQTHEILRELLADLD